jgi:outer membrane protein assembly factor BamB
VVQNGKVFAFTRQKDHEGVTCIDIATGKEIWHSKPYPAPYKPGPGAPGDVKTRSTPAVAGGRIFTLGVSGILSCFDAKTGKLHWRKDKGHPVYGASASPLIDAGVCIVQVGKGGLTAFDVATSDMKWCYDNVSGGPGYGSPVLVELAGERQLVTITQSHFLGVNSATGKLLWRIHVPRWDLQQCITPVRYKDLIIWKARDHTRSGYHTTSPVLSGDWLFGYSGEKSGHLFCLDAKTGKTLWQGPGRLGGCTAVLNAGSVWPVLTSNGEILIVRPSGTAYELITKYQVSDAHTWSYPVILGDRILIQDQTTLRCFRIRP